MPGHRVVQEGLSNALRHARGATISVRAARRGRAESRSQRRPPPARPGPIPGAGLGLAGLRERVAALGGTVVSGASPGGGFALRARVPLVGPLPR